MEIKVGNKKTVFDREAVKGMEFNEFEQMCQTLPTFKDLEPKARAKKIKSVYHAIVGKKKKNSPNKRSGHLRGHNEFGGTKDSESEQKSTSTGQNKRESEDNA